MTDSPTEARYSDAVGANLRRFGRWSGLGVALLGAVLVAGWALAPRLMGSALPEHFQTKPNTSLLLLLAGAAQYLSAGERGSRGRTAMRGLLLLLLLISGATLLEVVVGRDFGFDRWLLRRHGWPLGLPSSLRMSLVSVVECLLFAGTLAFRLPGRAWAERWAERTSLIGLTIGFLVVLGYTFGAHSLYALGGGTGTAIPSAVGFTLLFAGALAANPESGWMALLVSRGAGGVLLRRLLPVAIVAPWVLGWLSVAGSNAGLYSTHFDQVAVVLPLIFLFLIFLYKSAGVLDRLDEEREQRTRDVQVLNRELEARVGQRTQELMAANERLSTSSRYARELLEASLDPLVTISKDGKVMDVNRATELVTGRSRQELIGSDFSEYFTDPEEARKGYQQVFEMGLVRDYPLAIRHRQGGTTDVLYNATVFRDQAGEVDGVFAAARDITERKRAEQELRRLNRALRTISRCTNAVARAADEETLLRRVCEIVVEEGGYPLAWVGYAEDDNEKTVRPVAVAGPGADYVRNARITWADTERGRGPTGTAIRSSAPCYIPETTFDPRFAPWREAAKRHGYASAIALPLLEAGRGFGALNIYAPEAHAFEGEEQSLLLELTATLAHGILALRAHRERDRAAVELQGLNAGLEQRVAQRTAELKASTEEMEAFTYSVSHDLRAPLRHIDGFSKVLLEQCSGQLDDLGRHYLERVRQGTQQMGQLVDDLLNLSRLGRQALRLQPTALAPLVQELADELQPEASGRAVEWHVGALPVARCDRGLIRQVLVNLLTNALKFTRGRDPAVIEVGVRGGEVFIRDNGVGFDPQYAGKLFGVFQRLHHSDEFPGTGVGLATVRRILRKHGGDIRAESAPGAGATFYFTVGPPEAVVPSPAMEETSHAA